MLEQLSIKHTFQFTAPDQHTPVHSNRVTREHFDNDQ